jgi:hypothetical protein
MTRIRLSGSAAATRRDSRKSFPLPLVRREREDLFELIDHEHDLSPTGRNEIDRLEQSARS